MPPTSLVQDAHDAGLIIHTWTFRNERQDPGQRLRRESREGIPPVLLLGIDGLFSDFPDIAR